MRLAFQAVTIMAFVAILVWVTACATTSTPMPGNGQPDGTVYGQTAEQCAAQPDSVWCKPR